MVLTSFSSTAQNSNISKDSILAKLQFELKSEWDVRIHNDTLIFESNDFVWIDFYNNAPSKPRGDTSHNKYTDDYLQKNGKKTKLIALFYVQKKWDSLKTEKCIIENKKITTETDNLISKYQLSHLTNYDKDGKPLKANKEENDRFKRYKKEKDLLLEKITNPPIYNSEKYSLFIISKTWYFAENAWMQPMIYPKSAKTTIDKLENSINVHLKWKK